MFNKIHCSFNFWSHATFSKMALCKVLFCLGNVHPVDGLFLRGIKVETHFGDIREYEKTVCTDLRCQQGGCQVFVNDRIGGREIATANRRTVELPYDGSPVGEVFEATAEVVENALSAAAKAAPVPRND